MALQQQIDQVEDVNRPKEISSLPKAQPIAGPSPAEVFGEAVRLMMASPAHKHLFLTDMEWLALPPIMLRQCTLLRQHGNPFAFVSWAFLGAEAEARLSAG